MAQALRDGRRYAGMHDVVTLTRPYRVGSELRRKEVETFRGLVFGLGISVAVWSTLALVVAPLL